jgi:hypothetical protein
MNIIFFENDCLVECNQRMIAITRTVFIIDIMDPNDLDDFYSTADSETDDLLYGNDDVLQMMHGEMLSPDKPMTRTDKPMARTPIATRQSPRLRSKSPAAKLTPNNKTTRKSSGEATKAWTPKRKEVRIPKKLFRQKPPTISELRSFVKLGTKDNEMRAFHERVLQLRGKVNKWCRKTVKCAMVKAAKYHRVKTSNGEIAREFKDIMQSWRHDASEQNVAKIYAACVGQFETNNRWMAEHEQLCLVELKLKPDWEPNGKGSFITSTLKRQRSLLFREINQAAQAVHGTKLRTRRTKEETARDPLFKHERNGVPKPVNIVRVNGDVCLNTKCETNDSINVAMVSQAGDNTSHQNEDDMNHSVNDGTSLFHDFNNEDEEDEEDEEEGSILSTSNKKMSVVEEVSLASATHDTPKITNALSNHSSSSKRRMSDQRPEQAKTLRKVFDEDTAVARKTMPVGKSNDEDTLSGCASNDTSAVSACSASISTGAVSTTESALLETLKIMQEKNRKQQEVSEWLTYSFNFFYLCSPHFCLA